MGGIELCGLLLLARSTYTHVSSISLSLPGCSMQQVDMELLDG